MLVTQYGVGGADEWGGRFFAIGLPIVVPVAVAALVGWSRRTSPELARPLIASVVVMSLVVGVMALGTLRDKHQLTEDVVETVVSTAQRTTAGDGGAPVVIATAPAISRLGWRDVPRGRWLLVMEDDIADPEMITEAFERLSATDIQAVTVSVIPGYALPDPPGWEITSIASTQRGYGAAVYERVG